MDVPEHVSLDVRVVIGRKKGVQSVTEFSRKFRRGTKGHDDKHHLRVYHHIFESITYAHSVKKNLMSCHVISCHVMSDQIMSCKVM